VYGKTVKVKKKRPKFCRHPIHFDITSVSICSSNNKSRFNINI